MLAICCNSSVVLRIRIADEYVEEQKLVKQFYRGYIPHVVVLDARGQALYNQSGEVDSQHIEDIFSKSVAQFQNARIQTLRIGR